MGLSTVRTARLISVCLAILGTVLLTITLVVRKVLADVLPLAQNLLKDATALYDSFTGRLAVNNIPGHKELLEQLTVVKNFMPGDGLVSFAGVCIPLLIFLSVMLLGIAVFGIVKPRLFASCLVQINLLKWTGGSGTCEESPVLFLRLAGMDRRKIAMAGGILAGVAVLVLIIVGVWGPSKVNPAEKVMDLEKYAVNYVMAQKAYFSRNKAVGDAIGIGVDGAVRTDFFDYSVSESQFSAELREELAGCPAGSRWTISAKVEGFFSKELKLYRKAPADTNCVKLLPDFKNVGRKPKP